MRERKWKVRDRMGQLGKIGRVPRSSFINGIPRATELEETKSAWQGGSRSTPSSSGPLIQRLRGDRGNTVMAFAVGKRGQMCSEPHGCYHRRDSDERTAVIRGEHRNQTNPALERLTRGHQEPHLVTSAQPAEPTCNFTPTSRSSPLCLPATSRQYPSRHSKYSTHSASSFAKHYPLCTERTWIQ